MVRLLTYTRRPIGTAAGLGVTKEDGDDADLLNANVDVDSSVSGSSMLNPAVAQAVCAANGAPFDFPAFDGPAHEPVLSYGRLWHREHAECAKCRELQQGRVGGGGGRGSAITTMGGSMLRPVNMPIQGAAVAAASSKDSPFGACVLQEGRGGGGGGGEGGAGAGGVGSDHGASPFLCATHHLAALQESGAGARCAVSGRRIRRGEDALVLVSGEVLCRENVNAPLCQCCGAVAAVGRSGASSSSGGWGGELSLPSPSSSSSSSRSALAPAGMLEDGRALCASCAADRLTSDEEAGALADAVRADLKAFLQIDLGGFGERGAVPVKLASATTGVFASARDTVLRQYRGGAAAAAVDGNHDNACGDCDGDGSGGPCDGCGHKHEHEHEHEHNHDCKHDHDLDDSEGRTCGCIDGPVMVDVDERGRGSLVSATTTPATTMTTNSTTTTVSPAGIPGIDALDPESLTGRQLKVCIDGLTVMMPWGPIKRRLVREVHILRGLPRVYAAKVIAHEYTHAWLALQKVGWQLDPEVEEGLCELISYLWLATHAERLRRKFGAGDAGSGARSQLNFGASQWRPGGSASGVASLGSSGGGGKGSGNSANAYSAEDTLRLVGGSEADLRQAEMLLRKMELSDPAQVSRVVQFRFMFHITF